MLKQTLASKSAPIFRFTLTKCFYCVKPSATLFKDLKIVDSKSLDDISPTLKIYTKTGDKGRSSLYTGERKQKDDPVFEALGNTDELSSYLGFASSCLKDSSVFDLPQKIEKIQCLLQDVGSNIATPKDANNKNKVGKDNISPTLKIYTKTGDKGRSSLYTGERKQKDDPVFEALGNTDELSSYLGFASSCLKDSSVFDLPQKIEKIQCLLQDVGSNIATPKDANNKNKVGKVKMLNYFILPSGGMSASSLHVARTICRRAERSMVPLIDQIDPNAFKYINRLSDFLFIAARYVALKENQKESVYIKY
ncbi:hypothetical protein BB561_004005 [Smittium simulii]|uniref:Cobalamin adenosyltransferase-like domain-containing protein n=1 Tax=Smittium simulii TaxID=133385 RepID=A0A2T9YII1_9FUNG|nr:hypothetical protein BB561_004005 [Smittium simulii]